jgi:hypothetical protein
MRVNIFFILLVLVGVSCFGQESSQERPALKDEYLAKRKSLNTAGTVLLGAGLIAFTIAMGQDLKNLDYDWRTPSTYEPTPNMTWLYITSGAMVVGVMACYISATKYKRKAQAISFRFKVDKTEFLQKGVVSSKPLPALSITLPF